jgi:hypothetical protein
MTDASGVLTASIIRAMSTLTLMIEAVSASEASVNFFQTTRHNISEDSHLELTCIHIWTP